MNSLTLALNDYDLSSPYLIRKKICQLESDMYEALLAGKLQEIDFPLRHQFAPGMYIRTIFLPATTFLIGAIHRHQHYNFISKGRVTVLTEYKGLQELTAFWEGIEPAGTKRAIYVHEDTFWTTMHPTDETDPILIRQAVTAKSYTDIAMSDPVFEFNLLSETYFRNALRLEML